MDLKNDKETMMHQNEGQKRILHLLFDDIGGKKKEIG